LKNLYMSQLERAVEVRTKMSAKSMKTALKGTNIEEKDAKEIIVGVQAMYDKIPGFIRPMLPSLPEILRRIPSSAGKYTLNEIIQLLDWAYESGQLKK
jgi:hypothetical protein